MNEFVPETFETPRPEKRQYAIATVPFDHFEWLKRRTGVNLTDDFQAIAVVATNDIQPCHLCGARHPVVVGMVGYSDWTPNSVAMHLAFDERNKEVADMILAVCYAYPFEQNGRKIVFGLIREHNEAARRCVKRLGWTQIAKLDNAWVDGEAVIMYRYTRDEWRASQEKDDGAEE